MKVWEMFDCLLIYPSQTTEKETPLFGAFLAIWHVTIPILG